MKTKQPMTNANDKILSQVVPSGQYLSLNSLIEFQAFAVKDFVSTSTFSVMIDISFLLSLNLLAPNSQLLTDVAQG